MSTTANNENEIKPAISRRWMQGIAAGFACVGLATVPLGLARAQTTAEACKAAQISPQKMVDFGTAFAAADKRAHAWQPDAVVVRLTQTSLGPIDAEARSANWYMVWFSPATKRRIAITIATRPPRCLEAIPPPG